MVRFMCNGKLFLEDVFQKMCRKFIFIDVFLSSLHHVPSRTLLLLCCYYLYQGCLKKISYKLCHIHSIKKFSELFTVNVCECLYVPCDNAIIIAAR